jgi:hypothetical protein
MMSIPIPLWLLIIISIYILIIQGYVLWKLFDKYEKSKLLIWIISMFPRPMKIKKHNRINNQFYTTNDNINNSFRRIKYIENRIGNYSQQDNSNKPCQTPTHEANSTTLEKGDSTKIELNHYQTSFLCIIPN